MKIKVALFQPCYVRATDPEVIQDCRSLLEYLGCEVVIPDGQTCCGQPQGNAGYQAEAARLEQRMSELLGEYEVVVSPSASCITYIKEHYGEKFKGRLYEICEFIHDVLRPDALPGSFPHKVSLHNSCHGVRLAGLSSPSEQNIPHFNKLRDLLGLIRDIEVVEPERADECCGFGGLFSIEESPISIRMGQDKVKRHLATGAEYITAADSSCLMHQSGIISAEKLPIKTIHIVKILACGIKKERIL